MTLREACHQQASTEAVGLWLTWYEATRERLFWVWDMSNPFQTAGGVFCQPRVGEMFRRTLKGVLKACHETRFGMR